jgi:hypothetical protein
MDARRSTVDTSRALLSRDWGFYYTVRMNLEKVKSFFGEFNMIGQDEAEIITKRIDQLVEMIDAAPKTPEGRSGPRSGRGSAGIRRSARKTADSDGRR